MDSPQQARWRASSGPSRSNWRTWTFRTTPAFSPTGTEQDTQEKLCRVAAEAEKTGLQINIWKAEVTRVNNRQQDPVWLHQEDIKEVDKFVYLGSVVSKDGWTDEDIKCRMNKARAAFNTLRPIMEIDSPLTPQKDRDLQHQRFLLYGVSSTIWRRNLASNQDQHPQAPDIYQQMS